MLMVEYYGDIQLWVDWYRYKNEYPDHHSLESLLASGRFVVRVVGMDEDIYERECFSFEELLPLIQRAADCAVNKLRQHPDFAEA